MLNGLLERFAGQELVLGWNDEERKRIQISIDNLTSCIYRRLSRQVEEVFPFGSWTRNTILPRKYDENSDIDLMVVFKGDNPSGQAESYKSVLREVVDEAYPRSYVRKDAPAVKLELDFIKYDLVPAIKVGWTNQYYIPSTNPYSEWMATIPKELDPQLSQMNRQHAGNLVRKVIRLCKYWNKSGNRTNLSSYELESLILRFFCGGVFVPTRTYDCFLKMLAMIVGSGCQLQGDGTETSLQWIETYRKYGTRDKQLQWLNRLLPGVAAV